MHRTLQHGVTRLHHLHLGLPWHRALWLFYNDLILRARFYEWLLVHLGHLAH